MLKKYPIIVLFLLSTTASFFRFILKFLTRHTKDERNSLNYAKYDLSFSASDKQQKKKDPSDGPWTNETRTNQNIYKTKKLEDLHVSCVIVLAGQLIFYVFMSWSILNTSTSLKIQQCKSGSEVYNPATVICTAKGKPGLCHLRPALFSKEVSLGLRMSASSKNWNILNRFDIISLLAKSNLGFICGTLIALTDIPVFWLSLVYCKHPIMSCINTPAYATHSVSPGFHKHWAFFSNVFLRWHS